MAGDPPNHPFPFVRGFIRKSTPRTNGKGWLGGHPPTGSQGHPPIGFLFTRRRPGGSTSPSFGAGSPGANPGHGGRHAEVRDFDVVARVQQEVLQLLRQAAAPAPHTPENFFLWSEHVTSNPHQIVSKNTTRTPPAGGGVGQIQSWAKLAKLAEQNPSKISPYFLLWPPFSHKNFSHKIFKNLAFFHHIIILAKTCHFADGSDVEASKLRFFMFLPI